MAIGTHVGPFALEQLIGEGGMGTVFRARDARLHRDVAIKVLAPAYANDPERLRRFEQEALATAQLAHPNILAVYDVGTHEGRPYIVTELLEGATLREKIGGRALPVPRAIDYAIQIARGLAAAHARGIVHRDIKPENVFVTRDGQVKILDFGIAKLVLADDAADAAADTVTMHGSGPLGTASYMSPEQARGDGRVDHRADLFSLGVVLYEMLTGVSPFRRETNAETLTAILREEPADLTLPPMLARIVRHALEKTPADRFQSARDFAFDLESLAVAGSAPARNARRAPLWLAAALGALALGAAGYAVGRRTAPGDAGPLVHSVQRLTDFVGLEEAPAIAPDRRAVAFSARVNGYRQIFVRLIAGGPAVPITRDAVDHEQPRWSADSSSILYFSPATVGGSQGTLWMVPALGGAPRRVVDSIGGADISRDNRIAYLRSADGRVELVAATLEGADVRVVSRFDDPGYYKLPRWSPDAKWIAYQHGDGFRWDVFAVPSNGGTVRQVTNENRQIHGLAWMSDSRRLVYSSSRGSTMSYLPSVTLWEGRVDGGEPRLVVPGDLSYLHPDIDSTDAIAASRMQIRFDLWKYPVDGVPADNVRRAIAMTQQTAQVQTPTVGAHDDEIAFLSDSGSHANLWVLTVATGELRQITYERDDTVALGVPIWSPDGKRIAFVSSRGNTGLGFGVWLIDPDGGNQRQVAPHGLGAAWSHDGRHLYYVEAGNVHKLPADGGAPVQVRTGVRNVIGSSGTTLYFMVDRTLADGSAGFEIHAASPEDAPSRIVAQIPASRVPQWQIINPSLSPDGQSLAMPLTDGVTTNIWILSTTTGQWRQVTDFGQRAIFIARRVSWSADGRSIVAAVGEADSDIVLFSGRR